MYSHKAQEKPRLYGNFQDRQYSIWRNMEDIYRCDHESEVLIIPGFWGLPCLDYSKYGNHGTNHGATYKNGSLDFDGGDGYVDCGDTADVLLNTTYTISAWMKTDTIAENNAIITYRSTTLTNPILFQLDHDLDDVRLIVRDDDGNVAVAIKADSITTGEFYNVVGVRNGGTLNVYVNEVVGTSDTDIFGTITVNSLNIGALTPGSPVQLSSIFKGLIDEVRISNVARSADEIALFYDRPWDLYRPVQRVIYSLPAAGATIPIFMQNMRGSFNSPGTRGGFIN